VPQKATKTSVSRQKDAKERLEENPNLSFAELFDPQEDESESFADLLQESKLDWRHFKE
jgi:hypothetical protein